MGEDDSGTTGGPRRVGRTTRRNLGATGRGIPRPVLYGVRTAQVCEYADLWHPSLFPLDGRPRRDRGILTTVLRPPRSLRIAVRLDRTTAATPLIFAGVLDHARGRNWSLTDDAIDADGVLTDAPLTAVAPTVRVGPPMSYADVRPSPAAAAAVAAEHLLSRGHRHFVTVGVVDDSFAHAIRAAGATVTAFDFVNAAALPRPIAVYAENDTAAVQVITTLVTSGRSVPDDVAVLGQGDDVMACELAAVPVSSVDLAWRHVGRAAAARLGRLIRGQAVPAVEFVPLSAVVSRASTDALAIADADVAAAVRFIRENAGGPLRVGDVLRVVDLDRRTLERRFAKSLRRSPLEVLRRCRVDRAADLLRTTERPVTEIANACGFRLPQHLAAAFRAFRGQTPSDFRLLHRCDD